jgi:hypothetical protein
MRGVEKVRAEFALVCTAHNLLKLAQGRSLSEAIENDPRSGVSTRLRPPTAASPSHFPATRPFPGALVRIK